MKIALDEIKSYKKILMDVPYSPIGEKSKIFFELDTGRTVDTGSFVMEVKNQEQGACSLIKPGIVVSYETDNKGKQRTVANLAYAQTEYSPKFDIGSYIDIIGGKLSKSNREKLTSLDCLLVKKDYILAEFEL